jgi:hypothetical protein
LKIIFVEKSHSKFAKIKVEKVEGGRRDVYSDLHVYFYCFAGYYGHYGFCNI